MNICGFKISDQAHEAKRMPKKARIPPIPVNHFEEMDGERLSGDRYTRRHPQFK